MTNRSSPLPLPYAPVDLVAVAIGGLDAIAFTGGIGENAEPVRQKILAQLSFLGLSAQNVHVVKANEELTIARHVSALLGQ